MINTPQGQAASAITAYRRSALWLAHNSSEWHKKVGVSYRLLLCADGNKFCPSPPPRPSPPLPPLVHLFHQASDGEVEIDIQDIPVSPETVPVIKLLRISNLDCVFFTSESLLDL